MAKSAGLSDQQGTRHHDLCYAPSENTVEIREIQKKHFSHLSMCSEGTNNHTHKSKNKNFYLTTY